MLRLPAPATIAILLIASANPACAAAVESVPSNASPASTAVSRPGCASLLDFRFPELLSGKATSLCDYAGSVVLVVNTASECGFTPQYKGLEALYRRYQKRGLVVLGFPSNDFGSQEPGDNHDIAQFCELNYGVSFPMFEKTDVIGQRANPLYAALARKAGTRPAWNFHKYLIDRSGEQVRSFNSEVAPDDPNFQGEIESLLKK